MARQSPAKESADKKTARSEDAKILDGSACAAAIREELAQEVALIRGQDERAPGLAVIIVGDDPASHIYVKNKIAACRKVGIESFHYPFPADATEADILTKIDELNKDEACDGILIQLPLPKHLPTDKILMAVDPAKDADGLHAFNMGLLTTGKPGPRPCTPSGIMVLLERQGVTFEGKKAVVIGRSNLVGKPAALMLMERNATVTMCHSRSKDLDSICRDADILVVAAGRAQMVKGSWVKPGAVVVDVGIHRIEDGSGGARIVGDVDFAAAYPVASLITPVPGGIGPMTIAMLLTNTVQAYKLAVKQAPPPSPL